MLILLAIAAALLAWFGTEAGLGVSPDSIAYLSAAESIVSGRGAMSIDSEGWRPLTHYPPGYPFVLAAGLRLGAAPRWINILLFPLFILLLPREEGTALGAALLLTSVELLTAWYMAWSEPLFLVLLFACFALLVRYLERHELAILLAAALLAASCVLVRYVGIAVVAAGALSILLWAQGSTRMRLRNAALFGAVAMIPIALWLLRNSGATGRSLAVHPLPLRTYYDGAQNVWIFLTRGFESIADRIPQNAHVLTGALFVLLFAAAGLRERRHGAIVAPLLALFALVYAATFAAVGAFLDAVVFDQRLLLPLTVTGALLVVVLLMRWTSGAQRPTARVVVLALFAIVLVLRGRSAFSFITQSRAEGLGFNSVTWKRSPLMARVEQLPYTASICSNAPDALWLLAARESANLPAKYSPVTTLPNPRYADELRNGCGEYVAWFTTVPWRNYLASREELRAQPDLREIARESDGSLFMRASASAPAP